MRSLPWRLRPSSFGSFSDSPLIDAWPERYQAPKRQSPGSGRGRSGRGRSFSRDAIRGPALASRVQAQERDGVFPKGIQGRHSKLSKGAHEKGTEFFPVGCRRPGGCSPEGDSLFPKGPSEASLFPPECRHGKGTEYFRMGSRAGNRGFREGQTSKGRSSSRSAVAGLAAALRKGRTRKGRSSSRSAAAGPAAALQKGRVFFPRGHPRPRFFLPSAGTGKGRSVSEWDPGPAIGAFERGKRARDGVLLDRLLRAWRPHSGRGQSLSQGAIRSLAFTSREQARERDGGFPRGRPLDLAQGWSRDERSEVRRNPGTSTELKTRLEGTLSPSKLSSQSQTIGQFRPPRFRAIAVKPDSCFRLLAPREPSFQDS